MLVKDILKKQAQKRVIHIPSRNFHIQYFLFCQLNFLTMRSKISYFPPQSFFYSFSTNLLFNGVFYNFLSIQVFKLISFIFKNKSISIHLNDSFLFLFQTKKIHLNSNKYRWILFYSFQPLFHSKAFFLQQQPLQKTKQKG